MKRITRKKMDTILERLHACEDAREWIAAHPDLSPRELYAQCERGDWLVWLVAHVIDRRRLAGILCEIVPDSEPRPGACIDLLQRFADGDSSVTATMLRAADAAAAAAARGTSLRESADIVRARVPFDEIGDAL